MMNLHILNKLYKIHKVLQRLMTQIFSKFLPIISLQKQIIINTKIPLQTQPKIIPLFYLQPILILPNNLKHLHPLVKIMIYPLFHLNLRLQTIPMVLHNQVLITLKTHIQYIFKHQLHLLLLEYKLQLTLQLIIFQYKTFKLV